MNSEEALRELFKKSERENAAVDFEDALPIVKQAKKEGQVKSLHRVLLGVEVFNKEVEGGKIPSLFKLRVEQLLDHVSKEKT